MKACKDTSNSHGLREAKITRKALNHKEKPILNQKWRKPILGLTPAGFFEKKSFTPYLM